MRTQVLASVLEDALYIADNLRPADAKEIEAMVGSDDYKESLIEGFYYSVQPMTLHVDGKPAAMFGVVPAQEGEGCVWLLGTPAIEEVPLSFLRKSKPHLAQLMEDYDFLFNYAHKENHLHLKWLKWLGFDISEPVESSDFVFISYSHQGEMIYV